MRIKKDAPLYDDFKYLRGKSVLVTEFGSYRSEIYVDGIGKGIILTEWLEECEEG